MRKWDPLPQDATSIAAFRWFANQIENRALELFATDRKHFETLERVLRRTLRELDEIRKIAFIPPEENGCPNGWELCEDGICKPACNGIEAGAAALTSGARPLTSGGGRKGKSGKKR